MAELSVCALISFYKDIFISSCSQVCEEFLDHSWDSADIKLCFCWEINMIDVDSSIFKSLNLFSRNANMCFRNVEVFDFFSIKKIFSIRN